MDARAGSGCACCGAWGDGAEFPHAAFPIANSPLQSPPSTPMHAGMSALIPSPLQAAHLRHGGKLVPFAGFSMPVQFGGITAEHQAIRQHVGVFDISHMGQFFVSGAGATEALDAVLTNRVSKLQPGGGQYTLMLNEAGGVIDDLILYQLASDRYFLVVNASMIAEDLAWLRKHLPAGVSLEDHSTGYAGMAVQGPEAVALYEKLFSAHLPLPPRNGIGVFGMPEGDHLVCRTGYTGEDGFEFFCPVGAAEVWWERMLALGAVPCGLGARDTLRLESGYPLNGNDLSPTRTPLEAGLGVFVDLGKQFIGQPVLQHQKDHGLPSKLCGMKLLGKGPPLRAHYAIWNAQVALGETCSGGMSPTLGYGIALAYLPAAAATLGAHYTVEIRGTRYPVEIVKKSFYKRPADASYS